MPYQRNLRCVLTRWGLIYSSMIVSISRRTKNKKQNKENGIFCLDTTYSTPNLYGEHYASGKQTTTAHKHGRFTQQRVRTCIPQSDARKSSLVSKATGIYTRNLEPAARKACEFQVVWTRSRSAMLVSLLPLLPIYQPSTRNPLCTSIVRV